MRECKKEFIKNTGRTETPGKDFSNIPTVRYLHTCKTAKIGLIVTPTTEEDRPELHKVISSTCKGHCRRRKEREEK